MSSMVEKKLLTRGILMLVSFTVVLVIIFMPIFKGQNGLDFLDSLFNSISKGSAYYITETMEKNKKYQGKIIDVKLTMPDELHAVQTAKLFEASGATVTVSGSTLNVHGDIANILHASLVDSDAMYANDGSKISSKYGYGEREAMFNWWKALKEMDKDLKRQKLFEEAKIVATVKKKAVEMAYNYYGIEAQSVKDGLILIVFSLVFYVCYTLWYGFGIMFIFEGIGLKISH